MKVIYQEIYNCKKKGKYFKVPAISFLNFSTLKNVCKKNPTNIHVHPPAHEYYNIYIVISTLSKAINDNFLISQSQINNIASVQHY